MTCTTDRTPAPPTMGSVSVARLLADLPPAQAWMPLTAHRSHYPPPPLPSRRARTELIDVVERAGLRGRGGAGFPTATKWRAVASGRRRPIVVANGTEGEPLSQKDRLLLTAEPHLVLDGVLLAASAVGAERAYVCVNRTSRHAVAALQRALAERASREPGGPSIELIATPPRFVAGEETALVHFLNGGPAAPTMTPPRPYERGVDRRPTLVQNVETLAHVTQIMRWGPEWFRQCGADDEPGTALITLSGAVNRPGVLEVPTGSTLADVVGAGDPVGQPAAVLVGGFFGTWIAATDLHLPLSRTGLAPVGASPGCGVIAVLPEDVCGLAETARILAWYGAESAGQCGPCVFGLPALAGEFTSISRGVVPAHGLTRVNRWSADIDGRGACRHPDGAIRLLRSALRVFADDVDRHLQGLACAGASGRPVLPVPRSVERSAAG